MDLTQENKVQRGNLLAGEFLENAQLFNTVILLYSHLTNR